MKQLCLCTNAANKVCYSAGVPNKPKAERVTVCLTEQEPAAGTALLSVCHSGRPQGLPSCHWYRQSHDCAMYAWLKACPKSHMIIISLKTKLVGWQISFLPFHSRTTFWNWVHDSSPWNPVIGNKLWQDHNKWDFCAMILSQNETAGSHGGLSSRSDNHIGSTLLLPLCPAHSLWPVRLKKISSRCRPDLTQQSQLGLLYQSRVSHCSGTILDHA